MLKTLILWLTRHLVAVEWDGIRKTHWARDWAEALEWASCYPQDALVLIGKRGRLMAVRMPQR